MYYKLTNQNLLEINGNVTNQRFKGSNRYEFQDGEIKERTRNATMCNRQQKQGKLAEIKCKIFLFDSVYFTAISGDSCPAIAFTVTHNCEQGQSIKEYTLNKSKVKNRINNLFSLNQSNKNLSFYTVTYPKGLDDNNIYRIFNITLTRLRQDKLLKTYVWIAERQNNKTLHFHIISNDFIPIRLFNNYVRISLESIVNSGLFKYDLDIIRNYNGVDVDNLYKSKRDKNKTKNISKREIKKRLSYYLTKYVTKNNVKFKHLVWHSSRNISGLFTNIELTEEEMTEILNKNKINLSSYKVLEFDFCKLILVPDIEEFTIIKELREINQYIFDNYY